MPHASVAIGAHRTRGRWARARIRVVVTPRRVAARRPGWRAAAPRASRARRVRSRTLDSQRVQVVGRAAPQPGGRAASAVARRARRERRAARPPRRRRRRGAPAGAGLRDPSGRPRPAGRGAPRRGDAPAPGPGRGRDRPPGAPTGRAPRPARGRVQATLTVADRSKGTPLAVRVVIAEDEAIIRLDLKETLEEEGYEVVGETGRGDEAVKLVRELEPDVAILDIKMPGLDGLAAAREIAAERICAVLILTAFSQRDLIEEARDAGAQAYLVKPFERSELVPAVEVALGRFAEIKALHEQTASLEEQLE